MRLNQYGLMLILIVMIPVSVHAQEWQKYTNKEGQFSVNMPTQPQLQSFTQPIVGGKMAYNFYISELENGDQVFMISRNDYPEKNVASTDPQVLLDACVKGAVKSRQGKLITEEKVNLKGHPGRKISFSGKADGMDLIVWHECYLVKNRLYQVMVMSKKENPPVEKTRDRFFDSFELLKRN